MKFFDTHVHFFPDKLAGQGAAQAAGNQPVRDYSDGTRSGTVKNFAEWGCAGGMVLHIATNAHQQTSVNNFAKESQHGNLYCFGSVYPYAENALEEMERIKEMGLYGIKLHRITRSSSLATRGRCPSTPRRRSWGCPSPSTPGGTPSPQLDSLPCGRVGQDCGPIPQADHHRGPHGAHGHAPGGCQASGGEKERVLRHGLCLPFFGRGSFTQLVKLHGADKVLFATDCPWSTLPAERLCWRRADLSPARRSASRTATRRSFSASPFDIFRESG